MFCIQDTQSYSLQKQKTRKEALIHIRSTKLSTLTCHSPRILFCQQQRETYIQIKKNKNQIRCKLTALKKREMTQFKVTILNK